MKANGSLTNSMARARSAGLIRLLTRATTLLERSMEKVSSDGPTAQSIRGNFPTITSRAWEPITGLMVVNSLACGSTIRCTEMVYSSGPMVAATKAHTYTTRSKAMVLLNGLMERSTLATGTTAVNTAVVFISCLADRDAKGSGKTERGSDGLMVRRNDFSH